MERAKLTASDPKAGVGFSAAAVSVSGSSALVSSPWDDAAGPYSGAAYVFVRDGSGWSEQAKLMPSDGEPLDNFGLALSLSADTALVGAPKDDDKGRESGSAYVFVRSGSAWAQQAKLVAPLGEEGDLFGGSVSISGDTALIGAVYDNDLGWGAGAAYVFTRVGTSWTPTAKLLADDGQLGDKFGRSVALSGNTALIGSDENDEKGVNSGAAYIFVRNGVVWTQQAKLAASDGTPFRGVGHSTSLMDGLALVGTLEANSAYVFARKGTDWIEEAKLTASDGGTHDHFGISVAIAGRSVVPSWGVDATALVGAASHDGAGGNSGAAYYFARNGKHWNEIAKLTASGAKAEDHFGRSVALRGDMGIVGAGGVDGSAGSDHGAAFVYEVQLQPSPVSYCTAKPGLVCGVPRIDFSGAPSATAPIGFVITTAPALSNRIGVVLYGDGGRAAIPFQGGTLCLMPTIHRSTAVASGGTPGECNGLFVLDWNSYAHGSIGGNPQSFLLTPGQRVNVQVWGRDTVATGSLLSDGLEYFVCE